MLRIIGGQARGCRLLQLPPRSGSRPTTDRIKEALFNILPSMDGIRFLDLFAGTGNVGLEAMSRGADEVCVVENNTVMIGLLRKNIEKCNFNKGYEVLPFSVEKAIRLLRERNRTFDIIFSDPPYEEGWVEKGLKFIWEGNIFSNDPLIVIQHSVREPLADDPENFRVADQRKYGDTFISILTRSEIGH
jgi:16S rRNA (guanine(966)-N(2))-methyltransferase RsmD